MRFCFYSGYKDVKGGYTTLLINLIRELSNQGKDIVLINFEDGIIAKELNNENVKVRILDIQKLGWKKISDEINPQDTLIISSFHEPFYHLLKANPKVIYYDINDLICSISSYKFKIKFKRKGKKLISRLLDAKSLFFMDDTGIVNLQQGFDYNVEDPKFLPIPIPIPKYENSFLVKSEIKTKKLHCTYIGRAINWKIEPLKKILSDIYQSNTPIKFTIIVDNKKLLLDQLNLSKFKREDLGFEILENINPSQIEHVLLRNSDLNFGMGTTALHSAALGIPTILVDCSTNKFPEDYAYSWLFDTENFSLGKNIKKRKNNGKLSMDEVLNIANSKNSRDVISKKCFDYVAKYHDLKNIATQLCEGEKQAVFRLQDAKDFVPYYFRTHQFLKQLFSKN